jgi:hypothetical protein
MTRCSAVDRPISRPIQPNTSSSPTDADTRAHEKSCGVVTYIAATASNG